MSVRITTLLVALAVAVTLLAMPASGKVPFKVTIYELGTAAPAAELATEHDLMAFIQALYDEDTVPLPWEAMPSAFQYRLVAFFDAGMQHGSEMFYAVPRGDSPGVLYWPDGNLEGVPFLLRSGALDELLERSLRSADPLALVPSGSIPVFEVIGSSLLVLVSAALLLRRRSRDRSAT